MRILFEALDKKKGMTLKELRDNFQKATQIGTAPDEQIIKVAVNMSGSIKSFEIEA